MKNLWVSFNWFRTKNLIEPLIEHNTLIFSSTNIWICSSIIQLLCIFIWISENTAKNGSLSFQSLNHFLCVCLNNDNNLFTFIWVSKVFFKEKRDETRKEQDMMTTKTKWQLVYSLRKGSHKTHYKKIINCSISFLKIIQLRYIQNWELRNISRQPSCRSHLWHLIYSTYNPFHRL